MRGISLNLLALVASTATAQPRFAAATNIGTVDSVWSSTLKEQRPYLVYTPPSYRDTTISPQRYPVVYLLDGDAHFHSVTGLIQALGTGVNATYVIPELIVVAIPNTNRLRDMSPTKVTTGFDGKPAPEFASSGGMPAFLSFIKSELIPRIDSLYRTNTYRVFVGHSLGGITTINALYTIPEAFNAYVAIDPSLWWDNSLLLKQARKRMESPALKGKALYVAQANTLSPDDSVINTHFSGITQFDAVMKTYNTVGLRYAYKYYDQDDHGSVPLIAEYDALRFIFSGYQLSLGKALANPRSILTHFRNVSDKLGATFTPSEGTLRLLGTVAVNQDSTKAMELDEITTELYPQSYRAWNMLGSLALARGDKAKAKVAFERSLRVNPSNAATKELLKKASS